MIKQQKLFCAYRGDELLSIGTVKELAEEMGVTENSVRFMKSPTYHARALSERRVLIYALEDEEMSELDKKYNEVRKMCTKARIDGEEIKPEIVQYFKLFKKEYAEQLRKTKVILKGRG